MKEKEKESDRQRDRETERQGDRETGRQRDRETERRIDGETKRPRYIKGKHKLQTCFTTHGPLMLPEALKSVEERTAANKASAQAAQRR